MSIIVEEKFDSREGTTGENESKELIYTIRGTDDDLKVQEALEDEAPLTYGLLTRKSCHIAYLGPKMWLGEASYRSAEAATTSPPQTGESVFSFDIGGGTQHITQSRYTRGAAVAPYGSPEHRSMENFKRAIGVSGDGENIEVEGVDIASPVFNFSETHYLDDSVVTKEYIKKLAEIASNTPVCDEKGFRDYGWYEVLFLGASGSKRGKGDWEVTFHFAVSLTRTNITIGDITLSEKRGWDYMWVRYATMKGVHSYVKRPIQVNSEEVYEDCDFSQLGIGK